MDDQGRPDEFGANEARPPAAPPPPGPFDAPAPPPFPAAAPATAGWAAPAGWPAPPISQPGPGASSPFEPGAAPGGWPLPPSAAAPAWRPSWGAPMPSAESLFRSSRTLSLVAIGLLFLSGVLALVIAVHQIVGVELQGRLNNGVALQDEADSFNQLTATLAIAELGLLIVTAVAFLRWLWRTARNATLLDAQFYFVDPRGAVTAWLVPIRNLWKPYQVMRELHRALLAPLESRAGAWLIKLWWLFWVSGTVVGWFLWSATRSLTETSPGSERLAIQILIAASAVLDVADAALAIAVVRQVQRLSEAREAARRGNPALAIELVNSSQRRRVTLLPFAVAAVAIAVLVAPLGLAAANASAERPWQEFVPPDGKFRVMMPGTPLDAPIQGGVGVLEAHAYRSGSNGTIAYIVWTFDYEPGTLASAGTDVTFSMMETSLEASYKLTGKRTISIDGRPGREFQAIANGLSVKMRVCIDANRAYAIEVDAAPGYETSADVDRFLDSFHLT